MRPHVITDSAVWPDIKDFEVSHLDISVISIDSTELFRHGSFADISLRQTFRLDCTTVVYIDADSSPYSYFMHHLI